MRKRTLSAFSVLIFLAAAASCTFEYSSGSEGTHTRSADFVLHNTVYTVERVGEQVLTFSAEMLEMFDTEQSAELTSVSFQQLGGGGEITASGSCRQAVIQTNRRDAELQGTIEIYAPVRDITLNAEYLNWDNDRELLTGKGDDIVQVVYSDGSLVRGRGFKGDFSLNNFEFQEIIEGRMQYE